MARIRARNLLVEFPIYSASTRSLKNAVLHATTGGKVARDSGRRMTVTALDDAGEPCDVKVEFSRG